MRFDAIWCIGSTTRPVICLVRKGGSGKTNEGAKKEGAIRTKLSVFFSEISRFSLISFCYGGGGGRNWFLVVARVTSFISLPLFIFCNLKKKYEIYQYTYSCIVRSREKGLWIQILNSVACVSTVQWVSTGQKFKANLAILN